MAIRRLELATVPCFALLLFSGVTSAGVSYGDPDGGWTYIYHGDQDSPELTASLDGGWAHDSNDRWDGSAPGEEGTAPGGVKSFTEGDVTYLRIQDAGDPRGIGFERPSNRKIALNRDMFELDNINDYFLDDGFTFSFRARLATTRPLDPQTFDSQEPWPAEGRGYDIDFQGTGFITLHQRGEVFPHKVMGFSLADKEFGLADVGGGDVGGLLMNNLVADVPSPDVDTDAAASVDDLNLFEIEDLTQWHEFWITIQETEDGEGTHTVTVYADGDPEPTKFDVTAGDRDNNEEFCMCATYTAGAIAVDVDFIAYKDGVFLPTVASLAEDFNMNGAVDFADFVMFSNVFGKSVPPADALFDLNMNMEVDFGDFVQFSNAFGNTAEVSAVPEPNSLAFAIFGLLLELGYRRRSSRPLFIKPGRVRRIK